MRTLLDKTFFALLVAAFVGAGISLYKVYAFHVLLVAFGLIVITSKEEMRKILLTIHGSKFIVFWIFFIGWYALSIVWSSHPLLYAFKYLVYLSLGFAVILIINSYIQTIDRYKIAYKYLTFVVLLAIAIALLESFTSFRLPFFALHECMNDIACNSTSYLEIYKKKLSNDTPSSFWGNPNNVAIVMASTIPFFLFSKKTLWRNMGILSVLTIVFMAGSRASIAGLGVGILATMLLADRIVKKQAALSIILMSIATLFILSVFKIEKISSAIPMASDVAALYGAPGFIPKDESISIRSHLMKNGVEALIKSNGMGVGAGGSIFVQKAKDNTSNVYTMHNFWLEVLVDSGIIGFLMLVSWYVTLLITLLKIYKKTTKSFFKYHVGSISIALLIFAVSCVSASSVIYMLPMWVLFALSIVITTLYSKSEGVGAFLAKAD